MEYISKTLTKPRMYKDTLLVMKIYFKHTIETVHVAFIYNDIYNCLSKVNTVQVWGLESLHY